MATKSSNSKSDSQEGQGEKEGEKDTKQNGRVVKKPPDIYESCKIGYFIRVQELVEEHGAGILVTPDEKGYTPLHWTSLGGHTHILRYIIEHNIDLEVATKNEVGARAIHWACVNGHIAIVDILLAAGISIDSLDNKGCSPLIIAAQYGQSQLATYLMGKGARLQLTDKEGDNALHWAAFKGYCELTRLLIYSGFNPRQKDNFGQTPLHLACLSGNLNTVKMLCEQDGVEMDLEDHNHRTPLQLATNKMNVEISDYLANLFKNKKSIFPRINLKFLVFGPPGNSKGALLFFILMIVFYGYPVYLLKALPLTLSIMPNLHYIFAILNCVMWLSLWKAYITDPGYFRKNSPDYDKAIRQVAHYSEWKKGENPISRLCHTCRIVKPLRTKHCQVCNRCVMNFDHHCPYIYNCIGYRNRVSFFVFVGCVAAICNIAAVIAVKVISMNGWYIIYLVGLFFLVTFGFMTTGLVVAIAVNVVFNMTTNEWINRKRYDYLKDAAGNFYNPFNRGVISNIKEFFHYKAPMGDDVFLTKKSQIYEV